MLYRGVHATIGRTPLCEMRRIAENGARLLGKLDLRNPGGSVKDRIAAAMVEDAERSGLLVPGGTIVEATSGNTGIALAFVAATKGYTLQVTMPERMSKERLTLLRYLGAHVTLTPGALMREAIEKAEQLRREIPGAVALDQFRNPANPEAHRETTAREIWEDAAGEIDVFVAGVGTGGTITGVGEVLKARRSGCRVIAVEPEGAAVLSGRAARSHHLPGIGAGFIPEILNRAVIDEVAVINEEQAVRAQLDLARKEGISAGMSSGAALAAAISMAGRPGETGKRYVVVLPDGGERYAASPIFMGTVKKIEAT
jgi:cysteine synthase